MDEIDTEGGEEQEGQPGFSIELVKSYLAFAKRGLAKRKLLIGSILCVGLAMTGLAYKFFPRTFRSTTVLMTVANPVLDGQGYMNAFAGVNNLIMRRENLEQIVRDTDLVRKNRERRPQILKLKDSISEALRGKLSDPIMASIMVATLESRIGVSAERETLTVSVDWGDGATAADLVEAATQSFLKVRHAEEISAFSDKMAILDQHAVKLREEINDLAKQLEPSLDSGKVVTPPKAGEPAAAAPKLPTLRAAPKRTAALAPSPELKAELADLKQKLTTAENERNARIASERAKLDELKLKYTASHPQVVTQEERIALASQVPSELALLRSEVTDMEGQIRQQDALAANAKGGTAGVARAAGQADATVADALPPEVMQLLNNEDADPAKTAQITGAVTRYGHVRDEMRGVKLSLDVAQAAFNHRYQVLIPVEAPNKPVKPNLVLIIAGGIFLSLLIALAVPILLELRKGVIVEYWQVHHFELPVLAELRLPARRD